RDHPARGTRSSVARPRRCPRIHARFFGGRLRHPRWRPRGRTGDLSFLRVHERRPVPGHRIASPIRPRRARAGRGAAPRSRAPPGAPGIPSHRRDPIDTRGRRRAGERTRCAGHPRRGPDAAQRDSPRVRCPRHRTRHRDRGRRAGVDLRAVRHGGAACPPRHRHRGLPQRGDAGRHRSRRRPQAPAGLPSRTPLDGPRPRPRTSVLGETDGRKLLMTTRLPRSQYSLSAVLLACLAGCVERGIEVLNEHHCANQQGNATCVARYGGTLDYCAWGLPDGGCSIAATPAGDGCVVLPPEDAACYSPCGGRRLAEEPGQRCLGYPDPIPGATDTSTSYGTSSSSTTGATTSTDDETGTTTDEETETTTAPRTCSADEDCTAPSAPACDLSLGECVPCSSAPDPDEACRAFDRSTPVCADDT